MDMKYFCIVIIRLREFLYLGSYFGEGSVEEVGREGGI